MDRAMDHPSLNFGELFGKRFNLFQLIVSPSCASCPRTEHPAAPVASRPTRSLTAALEYMVLFEYVRWPGMLPHASLQHHQCCVAYGERQV